MKTITLTQGKVAIVDDEFFEALNAHKWALHSNGYAFRSVTKDGKRINEYMHKVVLALAGCECGPRTDHRDGDRTNNQLCNLRAATPQQNAANRGPGRNNKTGLKGVSPSRRRGYRATINVDGKSVYLGTYNDKESAARAYDDAALKHFGEFARLNFPPTIAA